MVGAASELVRWAYDVWPSYAGAIGLVSCVVAVLFLPLTVKQVRMGRLLVALRPQIEQIRRKYAADPARANEELLHLYRRNGAASATGCLLIVLQLAGTVLAFLVVRGLGTLDAANGGGPRHIDQGSALWESLRQDGGQLTWFGVDLARNVFTGPTDAAGVLAYLALPFALTAGTSLTARIGSAQRTTSAAVVGALVGLGIALVLPGGVVLYLLTLSVVNCTVVAAMARGDTTPTYRSLLREADQHDSLGRAGDAAQLRLDAVTTLIRSARALRVARLSREIQRHIVAAAPHRPGAALALVAELSGAFPALVTEEMTTALVRAWVCSPRSTGVTDGWAVLERVLGHRGWDAVTVVLRVCRDVGRERLTPEFRRGAVHHLRDHLDSAVRLASGSGSGRDVDPRDPAFQLLTLVLPGEVPWGDQLCALGDLAMARNRVPEALARYRRAGAAGCAQARHRVAYHEVREGHRRLAAGDIGGARRCFTTACELHADPEYLMLWTITGVLGERTDQRAELAQLEALDQRGGGLPDVAFWQAIAHLLRGEREPAVARLRRAAGREESRVLLAVLEGDDDALVDWARRQHRTSSSASSTGPAGTGPMATVTGLWPVVAAVARVDRDLLADLMAATGGPVPSWARVAGAHALLTRSTERAGRGMIGQALRDAECAEQLLRQRPADRGDDDRGDDDRGDDEQAARGDRLRSIAGELRAALAKGLSADEAAYAALSRDGQTHPWTSEAEDIWDRARGKDPWRRHHLAVLHHAKAYDLEMEGSPEAAACWTRALEHWGAVHRDDGFWKRITRHLDEHLGAPVDPAVVDGVRQRLPRDLLEPQRDLIVAYRAAEPGRAKDHMAVLLSAPFAAELVDGLRAGLVRDVVARVPKAIQTASYRPMLAELHAWLEIDPENAHLLQALLTVVRSSNERLLDADDELAQIERNVGRTERLVRPALGSIGKLQDHSERGVRAYAEKLDRLRPAVPSRAALQAEIARHEFWNGLVPTRKVQRQFSPDALPSVIQSCERGASTAVGHFALARLLDPQLALDPLYRYLDVLDARAETVLGLCLLAPARRGRADPAGAAQHLRRATALDPESIDAHVMLGHAVVLSGDRSSRSLAEASQALSKAAALLPATGSADIRAAVAGLRAELARLRGVARY